MSFSNLWDQADAVCKHASMRRDGLQDLVNLLKGRADVELRYSKGLEGLGNYSNCVSNYGTLGHAISALKSNWLNQSLHARTLAESVLQDVVGPMQIMVLNQIPQIKTQSQECRKITRRLKTKVDRCDRTKQKYLRSSMETEQFALNFEDVKDLSEEKKAKAVDKLFVSKRELDVSLERYIAALEDYNNNRVTLQDQLERQLLNFQIQEGQRLDAMKSGLEAFNKLEFDRFDGVKFDLKHLIPAIASIQPLSDIQAYVSSVSSNRPSLDVISFEPYNGTHPLFRSSAFPLLFHQDDWMDYLLSAQSHIRRPEIDILMNKVWSGESASDVEITQFRAILEAENGVRVWTHCLNRRRFESQFEVPEIGFRLLGRLMALVLEFCLEQGDARGIRSIIILSHTFYCRSTDPKVFLQVAINSNACWKDLEFWKTLLKDQIDTEFERFAELCMNEQSINDTQSVIKNLVFAQLSSFSHIMQSFEFVTAEAGQLLREYTQRFLLPYEETEAILVTIYFRVHFLGAEREVLGRKRVGIRILLGEILSSFCRRNSRVAKILLISEFSNIMLSWKHVCVLLLTTRTMAWWCTGHFLVAEIAETDLEANAPEVFAWAQTIIGYLAGALTHNKSNTFVESACWADDIKSYSLETMNSWHFVDQPYNPDGLMNIIEYSQGDALWAIQQVAATLNSTNSAYAQLETSFAMRYLIHLFGDIHQPLHVVELFDNNFLSGDQGGNLFLIEFDQINELHALWDSCLGHFMTDPVRPLNATTWNFLETQAADLMLLYPRSSLVEELSDPDPSDWAIDTYHLALKYAYNITYGTRPDPYYLEVGWQVVQKQLVLGGYRLSTMIQELYAQNQLIIGKTLIPQ